MSPEIQGDVDHGYGPVADAFRRNFVDGKELGAAVAVVRDGALVVDLWGGHRDRRRTAPWERDTLVTVFSASKGMTATAMAIAHSRGLFSLDELVGTYWPEFAQGGKQAVTVRQLLDHEAGLAVVRRRPVRLRLMRDHDRLGEVLAAQRPSWEPGTARGYHPWTLGWYSSQLLRRVDPLGRTVGQFVADEISRPLGEEFHIGLPDELEERRASIVGGHSWVQPFHPRSIPGPLLRGLMNPLSLTFKAMRSGASGLTLQAVNKRSWSEVEMPSVNGTGTARALARVYGDMASGGGVLGVGQATLAELERYREPAPDRFFGVESAYNCGFMKPFPALAFGSSSRAFGHPGAGGSFAFADPDTATGYAYVMNRAGYSLPTDPREESLREALDRCPT